MPGSKRRTVKRQVARRLRLASLLKHPTARRILDLGLDCGPSVSGARDHCDRLRDRAGFRFATGEEAVEGRIPWRRDWPRRIGWASSTAASVSDTVTRQEPPQFVIDWTGLELGTPRAADAAEGRAPGPARRRARRPPDDVFALGTLLAGWLPADRPSLPNAPRKPGPHSRPSSTSMRATDPAERPTAAEVVGAV